MRCAMIIWLAAASLCSGQEAADPSTDGPLPKLTFVLAGDSTVTDDAGWGAGFEALLAEESVCINLAKGGRSSRSYRTEGWWDECLQAKPDWLLIQFGHNDQPGKGPQRESSAGGDFRVHLTQFVKEARAAGIKPILVTSLERRRWSNGAILPTLVEYAEATRAVAGATGVPLVDLNRDSIKLYEQLGEIATRALEPMSNMGADHTHLSGEGADIIGQLVVRELVRVVPELRPQFTLTSINIMEPERASPESALGGMSVLETPETISITKGDLPVVVYNKQSPSVPMGLDPIYQRSGFLHPVATPAGRTVTATFPIDHAHQHGIFSAWVRTTYDGREIDFWNLAGGTGRVLHQRVHNTFNTSLGSGFEVDLIHRTEQSPVVDVLRESWQLIVYPTDGSFFCFDINSIQQALTDSPLVVQQYHYGGMALRGRANWVTGPQLMDVEQQPIVQEPNAFLNDRGSDRIKGNHEHARWVSLYGEVEGQMACITVLSHQDNFRSAQAARLHPSKPYFCFAPCVDGQFQIDRSHPLSSRYRYLVTDAEPDVDWINEQWTAWCDEEPELVPVVGFITLDGKPLDNALVQFFPPLGGQPAIARTDASGRYELKSDDRDGARLGEATVLISKRDYDEAAGEWLPEQMPAAYATRGLKYEIRRGRNVVDFSLSSRVE